MRGSAPVNAYSEFVGLGEEEQRRRIAEGVALLAAQGIEPHVWVAPAHGFDAATLRALRAESGIRILSDGFARRAVVREGFVWLPQQLWRPRSMGGGLWTICLHPNTLLGPALEKLARFIDGNREGLRAPPGGGARFGELRSGRRDPLAGLRPGAGSAAGGGTFREFEPGGRHYTWWSQMSGARSRNVGWRIDYFLISKSLRPRLKRAFIRPDVLGSDHCPVGIELE